MTQDEYKSLLLGIVDNVREITYLLGYLEIALEQSQIPGEKTLDKIELLLSGFLQLSESCFENLEFSCKDVVKLCNDELIDD